jgi:hypothetical protein
MVGYNFTTKEELNMGKNALAGKIRKGSTAHIVYQAMMTHPKSIFTSKDILEGLWEDYPKLTPARMVGLLGGKFIDMGLIERTEETRKSRAGRKLAVFHRIEKAEQPLIYDAKAKDQLGNSKMNIKRRKKKAPEIPEEIDALQLGVAMIDYVKHLQDRVRNLCLDTRDFKNRKTTEVKEKERQLNVLRHEIDGLKKTNEDLRRKLANKSRTFNTKEVLDFKRRKAQSSGIGN